MAMRSKKPSQQKLPKQPEFEIWQHRLKSSNLISKTISNQAKFYSQDNITNTLPSPKVLDMKQIWIACHNRAQTFCFLFRAGFACILRFGFGTKLNGAPCELQFARRCQMLGKMKSYKAAKFISPPIKIIFAPAADPTTRKTQFLLLSESRNLNMNETFQVIWYKKHSLSHCWEWSQWSQTCQFCKTWPVQCWTVGRSHFSAIFSSSRDLIKLRPTPGRGWHQEASCGNILQGNKSSCIDFIELSWALKVGCGGLGRLSGIFVVKGVKCPCIGFNSFECRT